MFCSHGAGANYKEQPIFQIDGNFGYTAGINEMLLQSQLGYVKGIMARGNFEINMKWSEGKAECFEVTSGNGGTFTGEYTGILGCQVKKSDGTKVEVQALSDNKIAFGTEAGETYTFEF